MLIFQHFKRVSGRWKAKGLTVRRPQPLPSLATPLSSHLTHVRFWVYEILGKMHVNTFRHNGKVPTTLYNSERLI